MLSISTFRPGSARIIQHYPYLFALIDGYKGNTEVGIINRSGRLIQRIGSGYGDIAYSETTDQLATQCGFGMELCIYTIPKEPYKVPMLDLQVTKIPLPNQCELLNQTNHWPQVVNIDWSYDANKLLIICRDESDSYLCIYQDLQNPFCWEKRSQVAKGDGVGDSYSRASWSPSGDLIVFDTGISYWLTSDSTDPHWPVVVPLNSIYIAEPDGNIVSKLPYGFAPSWSPDGNRIAFVTWDEERGYQGVVTVKPDGSDKQFIYRPIKRGSSEDIAMDFGYPHINFGDQGFGDRASKLVWSNDMKFIFATYLDSMGALGQITRINTADGSYVNFVHDTNMSQRSPEIMR